MYRRRDKFVAHARQLAEWAKKPNDELGSFIYSLSEVKLHAPIPKPSKMSSASAKLQGPRD